MSAPDVGTWARVTKEPAQALDDVDEIAVERACRGDRSVSLTRAEMAVAFLYLDSHGYSGRRMAAILGVTYRTVLRWRSERNFPKSRAVS